MDPAGASTLTGTPHDRKTPCFDSVVLFVFAESAPAAGSEVAAAMKPVVSADTFFWGLEVPVIGMTFIPRTVRVAPIFAVVVDVG